MVDGTEGRLALMASELRALKDREASMAAEIQSLQRNNTQTAGECECLQPNNTWMAEIQSLKADNALLFEMIRGWQGRVCVFILTCLLLIDVMLSDPKCKMWVYVIRLFHLSVRPTILSL